MTTKTKAKQSSKSWYNLILHLHPRKMPLETLRFNLTFGLGGMAALLVVIQVFTGLLLKFHYQSTPENAYNSVQYILTGPLFGKMAHNLHHWSAILLLWITFLHMLRVVFTGAYRKPRHTNWIFGIILIALVILSNFTGYLLPWDQLSYWAVMISTNLLEYIPVIGNGIKEMLLGGKEINGIALTNFFTLHTGVLPAAMVILMAFHFWRVRRAGGVIVAESKKDGPRVDTQPHLIAREFVAALVLIAFLLVLSIVFDAPLRERANPSFSPNPVKAPFYFMGIQELLIHFHPFFAIVVIPVTIIVAACRLPYIKLNDKNYGIWFLSENGKKTGIYSAFAGFLGTVLFILLSELLPDPETLLPSVTPVITTGLIPFLVVIGTFWLFLKFLGNKFSLNRSEYIQSVIILLIMAYTVLSIIGIFFRGEGMQLVWPWQI